MLCYHSVPRTGDWYYDTPLSDFENHIHYVIDNFEVIPAEDILNEDTRRKSETIHAVLTFDDGYNDSYANTFPIMKEYDVPVTFFISPGIIEESTNKVVESASGVRKEILSWEQVQEMSKNRLVGFGSHGLLHSAMTCLTHESALKEMTETKRIIGEKTGKDVSLFSYPSGFLNQETGELLRSAGYRGAFTSEGKLNSWHASRYEIGRVAVTYRNRDMPSFAYRISSILRRGRKEEY